MKRFGSSGRTEIKENLARTALTGLEADFSLKSYRDTRLKGALIGAWGREIACRQAKVSARQFGAQNLNLRVFVIVSRRVDRHLEAVEPHHQRRRGHHQEGSEAQPPRRIQPQDRQPQGGGRR
jgi:hypothetical protein